MKTLLRADNLTLSIANKMICRDLHFELHAGETIGILGPNGSGKTTFLHALMKLHPLQQGSLWLGDHNIASQTEKEIAEQMGILFQDMPTDFHESVFEYCLLGRHPHISLWMHDTAADHAITRAALATMELTTHLSQMVSTLSGGERRRLAIATLLTQTPQVFLLDEPTNHLDIRHQIHTLNLFKQLATEKQHGVILTLHDINMAAHYCDKLILFMGEGNCLQGTPDTVLTEENLYRLYQHRLKNHRKNTGHLWLPEFIN